MTLGQQTAIAVYWGPSFAAPFAAVVAQIPNGVPDALSVQRIRALYAEYFPKLAALPVVFPDDEATLDEPHFAGLVAVAWQEISGRLDLPFSITPLENNAVRIAVGFVYADLAVHALRTGMEIARVVFAASSGGTVDASRAHALTHQAASVARAREGGWVTVEFLKAARALGIPAYQVSSRSKLLIYGQGARSIHHAEAANSQDSHTGCELSQDKATTNSLIWRLGFPGVRHGVVQDAAAARAVAAKLGFPLVVKPVDRNAALGVSVGLDTMAEVDAAVALALPLSHAGQVLVERYVPGDAHRLTVWGGKLLRASRLRPPVIVADGVRSIADIIAADNLRRHQTNASGDHTNALVIDDRVIGILRKQGFAPTDRPAKGQEIRLAMTSNLRTGGTRENVTHAIHPDNAAMAEAIARSMHMDASGIDFITPDISKSWRDVPCAIIEVNANPGTSADMAEQVFRNRFSPRTDGRIPSVLVIGDDDLANAIADSLQARGLSVGKTNGSLTQLGGRARFSEETALPARIQALLFDATCEALVVSCTQDDIAQFGLPHTRYNIALIPSDIEMSTGILQLIESNAGRVERASGDQASGLIPGLLDRLLS